MSHGTQVLVIDDEPSLREMLSIAFRRAGYEVLTEAGVKSGIGKIRKHPEPLPLIVTDLVMPDGSGLDIVAAAKERSAETEVIMMTAHGTVDVAIGAMKAGASDFIVKPFSIPHMLAQADKALEKYRLARENRRLKAQLERSMPSDVDLGTSPQMVATAELVDRVAKAKTTVLITGESGTGKERIARRLHDKSDRSSGPFRVINCGALPEALMESELFGHEKGAFTGAVAARLGIIREADKGTLFLDEVGELPPSLQVKLLRVLQEKKVRAVGATQEAPVDVRVLAATNRDIEADVKSGAFRQDLYYRLNVIRITLPPLRERGVDIRNLAQRFVDRFASEMEKEVKGLSPDAIRALDRYAFPGNVRELENQMERAVALTMHAVIGLGDLPPEVSGAAGDPTPTVGAVLPEGGVILDDVLGEVERRLILQALDRMSGSRKGAAKLLGVTARTLRYRLAKLGIASDDTDDESDPVSTPP